MAEQAQAQEPVPSLAQVWQLPVLALSLMLFGVGLYLASAPAADEGNVLADLAEQVQATQYEQAIETAERLAERMDRIPEPLHGQFFRLKADALSLLAADSDDSPPRDTHVRIVEAYDEAQQRGITLDADQAERFAGSLAALGELEQALAVLDLDALGEDGAAARQRLLRRPIEQTLAQADDQVDAEAAEAAVRRLLDEDYLSTENEIWATARQAELLLRTGQASRAIDMLLRRLARLQGEDAPGLGELRLRLAQAYLEDRDIPTAERWFLRAQEELASDDPLRGEVEVGLGHIRMAEDNAAEAVEHYTAVVQRFLESEAYPEGLLGLAESEARLSRHDRAAAAYERAAEQLSQAGPRAGRLRDRLRQSLQSQYELRFDQQDYEQALAYLNVQRGLDAEPPADLWLNLAVAHNRRAEVIAEADADGDRRRSASEHRAAAADAYLAHADAVVVEDDDAYGESLWQAGTLYDEAGLHRRAVAVFERYQQERPQDPRRLAAMFRLAQAHQADGRPGEAASLYRELVEEHTTTPEGYAALVPLAQSYLAMGPDYIDRAEQVLLSVVTDHEALEPESAEFREALIELGQLYYRRGEQGDFERAIARLSEVVERYDDADQMPELRFQLGDAYRKSVQQIDQQLGAALPPSQRSELQAERAERLHEARDHFDKAITLYEANEDTLADLEQLYLRNSYFYRADCAYELGQYQGPGGAIALYEQAVQRYDSDPAALVGLVQIVNAYAELGEWDEARTANERAKVYLDAIPDEAFDDPELPMDREHWQRWLDWTSELTLTDGG